MNIEQLLEKQRDYFNSGVTLAVDFRIAMLKRLYASIKEYEKQIAAALYEDLGKSDCEGFMCEVGLTLTEISFMLRHIRRYAKDRRVRTPLAQFCSRSFKKKVPYGNVLIMSPWNYPFLLTMEPLADAIAAGNTAIIKPSAYSPATSKVIEKIIKACFPPEYVAVVSGGRKENSTLLEQKFDLIFFTGSQTVGREVLKHAAKYLTPTILELGGKSPCIVDETAKIDLAARRIVFGKYLNCGQTCVAPDYILCQKSIKDRLVKAICREIQRQYSEEPLMNPDYGRIINEKHYDRLMNLIDNQKVVLGGKGNKEKLQIVPTVMENVSWEDSVMQEEIFGPILPIITYENFEELHEMLADRPRPLAFYLFSQNQKRIKETTTRFRYGGGCINDVVIHLATSEMPFGGVGESGMGSYHGKAGFDAFSHTCSIVDKKTWIDLPMRYQPYDRGLNRKLLQMFLK